jgi:hypothetical protein
LACVAGFDHIDGDDLIGHGDEEAFGLAINIIERGWFRLLVAGVTWLAHPAWSSALLPG